MSRITRWSRQLGDLPQRTGDSLKVVAPVQDDLAPGRRDLFDPFAIADQADIDIGSRSHVVPRDELVDRRQPSMLDQGRGDVVLAQEREVIPGRPVTVADLAGQGKLRGVSGAARLRSADGDGAHPPADQDRRAESHAGLREPLHPDHAASLSSAGPRFTATRAQRPVVHIPLGWRPSRACRRGCRRSYTAACRPACRAGL